MRHTTYYEEDVVNQGFPVLGIISVWFGVLIISLTAVGTTLTGGYDAAWTEPFVDMLQIVLVALILASFLYLFFPNKEDFKVATIPLFINIGTLIILRLVPFAALWEDARFQWYWSDYQNVVQMVESGEWVVDADGQLTLPPALQRLSPMDGRVRVYREGDQVSLFFSTHQLDAGLIAGYIYRADSRPPQAGQFGGQWQAIAPKRSHWFYGVTRLNSFE